MGTNNFYPHENGIYVLELSSYEQVKEWMEEDEFFENHRENGLTDEDIYEQMEFEDQQLIDEFLEHRLGYLLEEKGYELELKGGHEGIIYNPKGKILAEIELKSGYYDGVQLIVETNPYEMLNTLNNHDLFYNEREQDYQEEFVKSKLSEVYSEHNVKMFKIIEDCTQKITLVGTFSNGEAVYELG